MTPIYLKIRVKQNKTKPIGDYFYTSEVISLSKRRKMAPQVQPTLSLAVIEWNGS